MSSTPNQIDVTYDELMARQNVERALMDEQYKREKDELLRQQQQQLAQLELKFKNARNEMVLEHCNEWGAWSDLEEQRYLAFLNKSGLTKGMVRQRLTESSESLPNLTWSLNESNESLPNLTWSLNHSVDDSIQMIDVDEVVEENSFIFLSGDSTVRFDGDSTELDVSEDPFQSEIY